MDIQTAVTKVKRVYQHFAVFLRMHYALGNSNDLQEGAIIDISRDGACIKIQNERNISKGDTISLEIQTKDFNNITINGEIIRFKHTKDGYVVDIKFNKLYDSALIKSINFIYSCPRI